MRPQRQQQEPSMMDKARGGFNITLYALNAHAMAFLPFTRTGFGVRGTEGYSFWAMAMILMYGLLADSRVMVFYYLPAWLLMLIWRKARADHHQHSFYQGWPWLTGWLIRNEYFARCAEAGLMVLFGGLLSRLDPATGLFVFGGVFSLGGKYVVEHTLHERRIRAARDWYIEADEWQDAMVEAERRRQKRK